MPGLFRTFDFPTPDASSPKRDATLVPQQALFLMNSPLALRAASGLAKRAVDVRRMYRICLGRDPDGEEIRLAEMFVGARKGDVAPLAQALLLSNEFVFVD